METRQRILEAAVAVFGRYGFKRGGMGQVASEAGLSRQGVYRLFPAKEDLFAACVTALHSDALAAGIVAARAARGDGRDAADVLAAQMQARFGHVLTRLAGSAHGGELLAEGHRLCGAINAQFRERFTAQLAETIRTERAAGRLSGNGPTAPELARFLIAAADGLKSATPPPSVEDFEQDLAKMVRLLVGGAARPPSRAQGARIPRRRSKAPQRRLRP